MAWRYAAVLLVCASGCSALFGLDTPEHAPADAAVVDTRIVGPDTPDACASASTLIDTCTFVYGSGDVVFNGLLITFDSSTRTFSNNATVTTTEISTATGPMIVLSAHSFTLSQPTTLRIIGSKPVALVASASITIEGTLVVTAGARTCGAAAGQDDPGGGGGGAGGGFGGAGGAGGPGDIDGTMSSMGGALSPAVTRPATLQGGCAGGRGGNANGNGGVPGLAGGALGLVAASVSISANGEINADGYGGNGGMKSEGGGGGGGSGGLIVIDASTIQVAGKLVANGGGGGEGAGNTNGGFAGDDGYVSANRALGGAGNASGGGDGGAGGAGSTGDGVSSTEFLSGGGGGGGGGVGFIALTGQPSVAGALISPPYVSWP